MRLKKTPIPVAVQKKKEVQRQEFIVINSPSVGTFHLMDPHEGDAKLFTGMNQRIELEQTLGLMQ